MTTPPTTLDQSGLDALAPRLIKEARWRDGTQDEPTTVHEAQMRRDLYYYVLGREQRLPPEWQATQERADLEASPEYGLYQQLHQRYQLLNAGLPVFDHPQPPKRGKEHPTLSKLGLGPRYKWFKPGHGGPPDDSGMAERIRTARKRSRTNDDDDDDESDDGRPPNPERQSTRLIRALKRQRRLHRLRGHQLTNLRTMASLRPSVAAADPPGDGRVLTNGSSSTAVLT